MARTSLSSLGIFGNRSGVDKTVGSISFVSGVDKAISSD